MCMHLFTRHTAKKPVGGEKVTHVNEAHLFLVASFLCSVALPFDRNTLTMSAQYSKLHLSARSH